MLGCKVRRKEEGVEERRKSGGREVGEGRLREGG